MSIQELETIELATAPEPTHSIIWLHGLGADGRDFEAIVPELQLPQSAAFRFIFPHAPFQRVTLNGGQVMRAWFDVSSLEFTQNEDMAGIDDSTLAIMHLVEKEIERGIAPEHIILAGFSQGGAIALNAALRYHQKLAGVMALSTYLPLHLEFPKAASDANRTTPIFMAHGTVDEVVKFIYGSSSRDQLLGMDYPIEWHQYDIGHGVGPDEIDDIRQWLLKVSGYTD